MDNYLKTFKVTVSISNMISLIQNTHLQPNYFKHYIVVSGCFGESKDK